MTQNRFDLGHLCRAPRQYLAVWVSLLLVALLLTLGFAGEGAAKWLAWQRPAIERGQWWRMLSGHFVHFTTYHAVMNSLGLMLLAYFLLWRMPFVQFAINLLLLPVVISLGLIVSDPNLTEYRGFSGTFYGLLIAGLVVDLPYNRLVSTVGIILLLGKVVYEQLPGFDDQYLIEQIGAAVSTDAHLIGVVTALVGNMAFMGWWYWRKR